MKNIKWNKVLITIVVTALLIMLSGCQSSSTNQTDTMNIGDMKAEMAEREEQRLQELLALKRDLDRHYGEGRAFKDYREITDSLNELYSKTIEARITKDKSGNKIENFAICKNTFYNDVLDKVELGEMTLEEVLSNPMNNIKNLNIEWYFFVEGESKEDEYLDRDMAIYGALRDIYISCKENEVSQHKLSARVYSNDILKQHSIEDLKTNSEPKRTLRSSKVHSKIYNINNLITNASGKKEFKIIEDKLKLQYGEEFIAIKPLELGGIESFVCVPERNLSLEFETSPLNGNMYLSRLVEEVLSKRINEIIKKHGAEGKIVQMTAPSRINNITVDTSNISDEELLSNKDWEMYCTTSFYYLKSPDEEIDYQTIISMMKEVQQISQGNYDYEMFMFFYEVEEEERNVIVKLFNEMGITQQKMQEEKTIFKLESLTTTEANNDAFNYLYTHGEKEDCILSVYFPITMDDIEEFLEKYTMKGIWG